MSSNVVITVGISGCGKTTAFHKLYPDYFLVEPDIIREKLTGSVSDQSKNKEVFEIAYKMLQELLSKGENVYWSATNLGMRSINQIIDTARSVDEDTTFTILVFKDSAHWEDCAARVEKDIKSGVNRSDTWNVMVKDNETNEDIPLIKSMSMRFKNLIKSSEFDSLSKMKNVEVKEI